MGIKELTDDEWRSRSKALAEMIHKRMELKDELANVQKDYRERIGEIDEAITDLARQVRTRQAPYTDQMEINP